MCQGFCHFAAFLHYFVLAKLAPSIIRVNNHNTVIELVAFYLSHIIDILSFVDDVTDFD